MTAHGDEVRRSTGAGPSFSASPAIPKPHRCAASKSTYALLYPPQTTRRLFCASYATLNDPVEGFFEPSRMLKKNKSYDLEGFKTKIKERINQIGLCSFSEVRNHELMWAHYANQYRGICIEYDFGLLRKNLPKEILFARMTYNERAIVIGNATRLPDESARRALSQKNYRWLYEREWRMFGPQGPVSYRDVKVIKYVYMGFRVSEDHIKQIKSRLSAINIKTRLMKIENYSILF